MKKKITIVAIFIAMIICGIGGYLILSEDKPNGELNVITAIDYNDEELKEELNQQVEDSMINIQYSLYAEFDGTDSTSFFVRNIKNNHHPIRFQIFDEEGEQIYESEEIDLGYEMTSIRLDKELEKGSHKGTIQIGYVDSGNVSSIFPIYLNIK